MRLLLAVVAALAAALSLAVAAHAGPRLLVGIDDDTVKWMVRPDGVVGVDRDLGVDALRITLPWRGQGRPSRLQQVYLHRISLAVALGQRVVLAVYGRPEDAPLTAPARDRYCGFLAHVLKRIPQIDDVVVWNEVNNPTFWPRRAGAAPYEQLLATCWDALHALRPTVNVVDSTAPHQDPGSFIAALGAAYRASGRTRPIADTFGHNVYPDSAAEPPWIAHPGSRSIDEGDYARLTEILTAAFGGTAQPLPGTGRTTIWYLEDGYETAGRGGRRLDAAEQASRLQAAVRLAYCQPSVGAFFNFELLDEHRAGGWQSGLLYADGSRKPAYDAYKQAIAAVHAGSVDCARAAGER